MLVDNSPTQQFLKGLGEELRKQYREPKAIVCISGHWDTSKPTILSHRNPPLIYDFFGFPQELYNFKYTPLGHPPLALQIQKLLQGSGFMADVDPVRGLDHGAWVPVSLMYPNAQIPVLQVSIQCGHSLGHHFMLGEALLPLREEGVLIIGSGGATHNLRAFKGQAYDEPLCKEAKEFAEWLRQQVLTGNRGNLEAMPKLAPSARWNHPTPDHILPLFVAMGAASDAKGNLLHSASAYGILSLDSYLWT